MYRILLLLLTVAALRSTAQKQITLQDIYQKGTFRSAYIPADFGVTATNRLTGKDLVDKTGKSIGDPSDIINASKNNNLSLITTQKEPIYRHSSKSLVYLYNSANKELIKLDDEKLLHPTFSPDATKIAYVKNNNLYIYDIASRKTTAVTTDGKWNYIINGNCDWVYEEEFQFTRAYEWSPNSNYLAYYRFDESKVKEYTFTDFDNNYNTQYTYKYPKAGEDNSKVEIHIYETGTGKNVKAKFDEGDIYIPRIKWSSLDNQLVIYWMNRHQNNLKLLLTDARSGAVKPLYEETNKDYIEITDDWWFLKDRKHFIFTSEMDGFTNLYRYSYDGKTKIPVTKAKYDVASVNGVDEANQLIYYTAAYPTPMDRTVFVTDFSGKLNVQLTKGSGTHDVAFSADFKEFYDYYSTINTPSVVTLYKLENNGKTVTASAEKVLTENDKLSGVLKEYNIGKTEFVQFSNDDGDKINGWMLKPANFDATKRYPVLFCNYGGPGSQSVANKFGSSSMWHQLLAQKGFIVASFDNTGTGYRGEAFRKKTYQQLGKYEIADQIAAAKWLGTLPYIDKDHIGHWGWSFGGFMSSLAITKGAAVFSAALAVAPVTNWRFYDNIYTERYMRTPKENPNGYDKNSPINFTDKIKGKYMIIHGTADDNVHFQNSTQMVTALIKNNIPFESAYYPNKNHSISGQEDNTTVHLWTKMTNWILQNLGNQNTDKTVLR